MAKILGLDDKILEIIQIELDIEKRSIVNSKLINVLKKHKNDIYLVSIYLSKKHIEGYLSLDMI